MGGRKGRDGLFPASDCIKVGFHSYISSLMMIAPKKWKIFIFFIRMFVCLSFLILTFLQHILGVLQEHFCPLILIVLTSCITVYATKLDSEPRLLN